MNEQEKELYNLRAEVQEHTQDRWEWCKRLSRIECVNRLIECGGWTKEEGAEYKKKHNCEEADG